MRKKGPATVRPGRWFVLWITLAFAASGEPARGQEIESGYNPDFPLAELKTFNFFSQKQRGKQDDLAEDREAERQIRESLAEQLRLKGFELSSNPHFVIAFYAKAVTRTRFQANAYGAWDSTLATISPENYEVGTLVVDFVNLQAQKAVWRGVATKSIRSDDPESNAKLIRKASEKLINRFLKDGKKQAKRRK
jgi:hypothetical protein